MSLFDPDTGAISDAAFGLDTQTALADQGSIFESMGNIVTKGLPLAGISVLNTFANTGAALRNWLTGPGSVPEPTTQEVAATYLPQDYGDYYATHQEGIEATALIGGSFIPGMAGIKALKLAQAGKAGLSIQRATNLFSGVKEAALTQAVGEINSTGGGLFGTLSSSKLTAIAAGYGDQALQALAFETAVAGTMHASPLLSDSDFGDVATNMFYGVLLGGVVGGSLEALFLKGAIRRAEIAADVATKPAELTQQYGFAPGVSYKGNSIAGDRAALLLNSVEDLPGPESFSSGSNLAGKKLSDTQLRADTRVRLLLGDLAGKGNEDLSTGLADTLADMKVAGQSRDEIAEKLVGLAKISRITDEPSVPVGDTFYVNRFASGKLENAGFEDLITSTPHPQADLSLRYAVKPLSSPVIAKITDTVELTDGSVVPRYATAKEAFEDGADIYLGKDLKPQVNPSAPNLLRVARPGESRPLTVGEEALRNPERGVMGPLPKELGGLELPSGSKPLTGAPIILNTITKDISSSAVPVVGDYGAVKLVPQGLTYGGKLSVQDMRFGLEKLAEGSAQDANARYVWAARRGIKAGDTISSEDIPLLEELYRGSQTSGAKDFSTYMDGLRQRKVTFSDGSDLPYSEQELLSRITGAKDDLVNDLISKNPKMSSEEVAIRANVPERYIADSFHATKPEDFMVPPEQSAKVNHIQLEYDIGNTRINDGQISRGLLDSQYRISVIQDALNTAMAKEFGSDWQNFKVTGLSSKDANIAGTGAKFLTYSNAEYGTLEQQLERIGRFVGQETLRRQAAYSEILAPHANAMRADPQMAAEVGAFVAVRRRTGEQYVFLPPELAAKNWRTADTVVLKNSLIRDKTGAVVDWNKDFTPSGFLPGASLVQDVSGVSTGVSGVPAAGLHTFYDLSPKVAAFERAQMQVNDSTIRSRNNWWAAMGITRNQDLGTLYAPAIDTARYPYFALVRAKAGTPFSDDSVSMIVGKDQASLEAKSAALRSDFDIIDKSQSKDFRVALGDYQYDRNFMQNRTQADMTRKGVLNDVFPETRAEDLVQQYVSFNNRQASRTVRDYVEMGNAQLFAEIDAMGAKFEGAATSKFGFVGKYFASSEENPYASYKKTALNIGPRDEYKLWADSQEKAEAFASSAFNTAKSAIISVQKGVLPLEDAAGVMERAGLENPYAKATDVFNAYYGIANKLPETKVLSRLVAAGNLFQSATAVRLDWWQSFINVISTPILTMAETSSIVRKFANSELKTELPDGSGRSVLSTTKPIFGAIADFFNPAVREEVSPFLKATNITRSSTDEYFQAINNLAIPKSGSSTEAVLEGIHSAVEVGAKLTGSQWTENFARTISALTARRIFMAEGLTAGSQELNDNMITFVNRVHGNYVASQRPVAFQGPIGQAMSLFQTYQFNFFQQLFRYIENGEAKTLATLTALQTGLFGMQGLPGFQFINQHLVGNAPGNPAHADLYSATTNFFDKKLGDYLLYGVASNWLGSGLYSRGDINPRSLTVLPVNPLDFPAISGALNFVGNLLNTADKIVQGGSLSASLLQGLEHNGISRPLSGLGQLMQGYVSSSQGQLISAVRPNMGTEGNEGTSGWSDVASIANFSRLMGARPLDEAIAMDMNYRSTLYTAKDTTRMERLGGAVKEDLAGNAPLAPASLDSFIHSYANAGGEIQHFGQQIMKWSQEANVSKANEIFRQLSKPMARTQMEQMGGVPLPDFQNRGNVIQQPLPSALSSSVGTTPSGSGSGVQ